MSNFTGKKKDTVITDGSGQEKDIAPVQSNYGSKWGSAGTGFSGNGKTSYGSRWLSKAIFGFGSSANGNGSGLVKTRYAAYGTEPEKVEDGGGAKPERLSDDLSGGGTGEGISSGGEGGGNGDTGGSNYTGTNTTYEPSIEQKRQSAYTEAEKERQRAIVDAHNAYETNKSNYGANAEALGAMGLTGSGYSDYMNSSAYATARGEVQKAKAQSAYTKRLADETAAQEQLEYDSLRLDKFNSIISNIGDYKVEQLEAIITENGFTEEQADAIRTAANNYATAKASGENIDTTTSDYQDRYTAFETNAYNSSSKDAIIQSAASSGVTEADRDAVISNIQNEHVTSILGQIASLNTESPTTVSTAIWDQLLSNGLIPEDKKATIAAEYSKTLDTTSGAFVDPNNTTRYVNENEARAFLHQINSNQWIDQATKDKYNTTFNQIYGYSLIKNSNEYKIKGLNDYSTDGNNFEIKVGENSTWDVQTKAVDTFTKQVLVDKGVNGLYMLNDKIYLKSGGNVAEVVARNTNDSREEFAALKKWLGGQVYN